MPTIKVEMKQDSTYQKSLYFYGQISDDYGINGLKLYYYPVADPDNIKEQSLPVNATPFQEFTHVFPSNLELIEDAAYALYFEVSSVSSNHDEWRNASSIMIDTKDFGIGAQILHDLNIHKLGLISNSEQTKRVGIIGYGLEIVDYINY